MTTQNKKLTAFLVSLALCILLFYAATSLHLEIDELYLLFGAAAAGILRVCMGTVTLAGLFLKNRTGYAVFAVTDIVLALMTVAYAVYDIKTSTGWFAGLLGMLLLVFVLPVNGVYLLIDLIAWHVRKKKEKKGIHE